MHSQTRVNLHIIRSDFNKQNVESIRILFRTGIINHKNQQFYHMLQKQRIVNKLRHYRSVKTDAIEQSSSTLLPKIPYQTSASTNQIPTTNEICSQSYKQPSSKWKIKNKFIDRHRNSRGHSYIENRESSIMSQEVQIRQSPKQKAKIFFTNVSISSESPDLQESQVKKEEVNQAIQKSKEFISIIKQWITQLRNQRKRLIKLNIACLDQSKQNKSSLQQKQPNSKQIYSYFSREFINSKDQQINDEVLDRFISHSPPGKLQSINIQSRQFLLGKMHSDYKNHSQVQKFKKERIKSLMTLEMEQKKKQFKKDYRQRYNIPYFSFLTLNKQQQKSVLNRQARKSLV